MNIYYVYAYLRKDFTPYYIGKGSGKRAYNKGQHEVKPPSDRQLIAILEANLTETGAFALERRYIRWYGRKDLGTGILRNRTDGGDGAAGARHTEDSKQQIADKLAGRKKPVGFGEASSLRQRGKKLSNAHLEKVLVFNATRKGKPGHLHTDNAKAKISAAKMGKPNPAASKALKGVPKVKTVCRLSDRLEMDPAAYARWVKKCPSLYL